MDAVTTVFRACFPAQIAPAISIHDMTVPPKMVPSALVCWGSTISVMVTADSDGALAFKLMVLFNQRFPKISVANFFDAVGY